MAVDKEVQAGNKLRDQKKFEESIIHYDNALRENPKAFTAHYEKSIALQRLKRYDEALVSLTQAKKLAIFRARRNLIGDVLFRYATLYFAIDDVSLASKFLRTAEDYGRDANELSLWKLQIKNKAEKLNVRYDPQAVFESLDDLPLIDVPETEHVDGPKIEEIEEIKEIDLNSIEREKRELEEKMRNKDNLYPKTKDIRRDWFQSNQLVTVSIFIKNLPKDNSLKVNISKNSFIIEFPTSASSEFQYEVSPLFSSIKPKESSYKVFSTKIELYLAKENPAKWSSLEKSDGDDLKSSNDILPSTNSTEATTTKDSSSLQYPTSSKKQVDWSKLSVDDDEEEAKDENAFFQELYKNADEDTKRAMMKSYIESNGTALSTNWDEVSKKTYETTPPDGLEAKKW